MILGGTLTAETQTEGILFRHPGFGHGPESSSHFVWNRQLGQAVGQGGFTIYRSPTIQSQFDYAQLTWHQIWRRCPIPQVRINGICATLKAEAVEGGVRFAHHGFEEETLSLPFQGVEGKPTQSGIDSMIGLLKIDYNSATWAQLFHNGAIENVVLYWDDVADSRAIGTLRAQYRGGKLFVSHPGLHAKEVHIRDSEMGKPVEDSGCEILHAVNHSRTAWSTLAHILENRTVCVGCFRWFVPSWVPFVGGIYFGWWQRMATMECGETRNGWMFRHPGLPDGVMEVYSLEYDQTPGGRGRGLHIWEVQS